MYFSVYTYNLYQLRVFIFFAAGSKPFFYGTNNLACIYLTHIGLHRKKRSLQLPVHNFVHSFIYYDGWFAEFGTKDTTLRRHSPKNAHCGPKIMHPPAGFSKLPFDCIRRCASKYHLVFGQYNLLNNNCHYFSNRMMEVLCHEVTCPLWCLWLMNCGVPEWKKQINFYQRVRVVSSVVYVICISNRFGTCDIFYFLMVLYINRVTCIWKTSLALYKYDNIWSIFNQIAKRGVTLGLPGPPHLFPGAIYLVCTQTIFRS